MVAASRTEALRAGDILETIDGRPFEEFFRELRPLVATSTEQWARRALFSRLGAITVYAHLFPERFVLGLEGGRSEPEADAYTGRLALLVDGGCFSACEDFVMPFKDNARAIVVGETTGGSTGQPYMLDLGDGMQAIVGAKREMFPDGARFEGVGIRPDVEVSPTVDDLRSGRDVVLEAARQRPLQPQARP